MEPERIWLPVHPAVDIPTGTQAFLYLGHLGPRYLEVFTPPARCKCSWARRQKLWFFVCWKAVVSKATTMTWRWFQVAAIKMNQDADDLGMIRDSIADGGPRNKEIHIPLGFAGDCFSFLSFSLSLSLYNYFHTNELDR